MTGTATVVLSQDALTQAIREGEQPTVSEALERTAGFICPGCFTVISTDTGVELQDGEGPATLKHSECGWSQEYERERFDTRVGALSHGGDDG